MFGTPTIKCAADSHAGRERTNNEDRYYLNAELGIFFVVDGVGGHAAGEVAADVAVKVMRARLERQIGEVRERIIEGVTLANNEIYRLAQDNENWAGMACVLTAAVIQGNQVTIGHVGDTRLYKIRNSQIKKITPDHSPVGELEDSGQISEIEAMAHPRRNEILRDVGSREHTPDDENFIDIIETPFESDCALLICSDGLSDLVTSEQMLHVIKHHAGSRSRVVRQLIESANRAGGKDNITAVLVEGEQFGAKLRKEGRKRRTSTASPEQTKPSVDQSEQPATVPTPAPKRRSRWRMLTSRWTILLLGAIMGIVLVNYRPELMIRSGMVKGTRARVHFVGKDGSATFTTIGDALKQANAGDTIVVGPGDYLESIRLKNGVTLVSQIPRQAILRLPAGSRENVVAVADRLSGGRFAGFRIEGTADPSGIGLQITDSQFEVDDVEISACGFAGVEISGASTPTLRTSHIHDNLGSAIVISNSATPRLVQNRIVNNGRGSVARPEIDIVRGQPELVWNVISGDIESISGLASEHQKKVVDNNFFRPRDSRQSLQGSISSEPETVKQ